MVALDLAALGGGHLVVLGGGTWLHWTAGTTSHSGGREGCVCDPMESRQEGQETSQDAELTCRCSCLNADLVVLACVLLLGTLGMPHCSRRVAGASLRHSLRRHLSCHLGLWVCLARPGLLRTKALLYHTAPLYCTPAPHPCTAPLYRTPLPPHRCTAAWTCPLTATLMTTSMMTLRQQ